MVTRATREVEMCLLVFVLLFSLPFSAFLVFGRYFVSDPFSFPAVAEVAATSQLLRNVWLVPLSHGDCYLESSALDLRGFSQLDGGMISGDPTLSCTVHLVWWQLLSAVVMGCVVGGCDDLSCAFVDLSCAFVDLSCAFVDLFCEFSRLLFAFVWRGTLSGPCFV